MKCQVTEIELSELKEVVSVPAGFDDVRILVRTMGSPIGWIDARVRQSGDEFGPAEIRRLVEAQLPKELLCEAFLRECMPEPDSASEPAAISIIVCTRDRPEHLDRCLEALAAIEYAHHEIIVVDNASSDSRPRDTALSAKVRYVREPRPGLDWARNRGVAVARHDIVAFIDDDARADSQWLRQIDRAFRDPDVMAVTGLVVPAELDTSAQNYFELVYGGMGKGFCQRTFHRDTLSDRDLLWASGFGVGANMAFRRSVFGEVGGFDPALDVGTPARGGGDVEFFHRLVARGHLLSYEPGVIVWHEHRRSVSALRKQILSNGCGMVPYLRTCLRNRTVTRIATARFLLFEILGWWLLKRLVRPGEHQRQLVLLELAGLILGFFAYRKSRRAAAILAKGDFAGMIAADESGGACPTKTEAKRCAAL